MILFYGCWTDESGKSEIGHYFFGPSGRGQLSLRRRHDGHFEDEPARYVPWGYKVDGGLAPLKTGDNGIVAFAQAGRRIGTSDEEWWSAISWWDNSVDSRSGSSSTFLLDRRATAEEVLAEAKKAFPQIFARFKYELVMPEPTP